MPPKPDPVPEPLPVPGESPEPVELKPTIDVGATFGGEPVRTLRIEMADGRWQRLELLDAQDDEFDMPRLSATENQIVDLFLARDPGTVLKGPVIARALNKRLSQIRRALLHLRTLKILHAEERQPGYMRGENFPA